MESRADTGLQWREWLSRVEKAASTVGRMGGRDVAESITINSVHHRRLYAPVFHGILKDAKRVNPKIHDTQTFSNENSFSKGPG
jgi:hypothetical protein